MVRFRYYSMICILILPVLIALYGCVDNISGDKGLLEGKISIGPICPVETDPPAPGCLPTAETYNAYPVGIWTQDGSKMIALISPSLNGSYSVSLVPGQYLVKLEKESVIGGSNLPVKIMISSLEKTVLNIDIDTGIR